MTDNRASRTYNCYSYMNNATFVFIFNFKHVTYFTHFALKYKLGCAKR